MQTVFYVHACIPYIICIYVKVTLGKSKVTAVAKTMQLHSEQTQSCLYTVALVGLVPV